MMGEFINTGKLVGGGKLKKMVVDYVEYLPKVEKESKMSKSIVQVRLRKVKGELDEIRKVLEEKGQMDPLVPNLYHLEYQNYSEIIKLNQIDLLHSNQCVMQSLSSCLPAYFLFQGVSEKWKGKKFDIIDACAAPGNKTIQLAEYLG